MFDQGKYDTMTDILCPTCFEEYVSKKRWDLGYHCCLKCGAKEARKQAIAKSKRISPIYSKGPYQYITDGEDIKDLGK